MCVMSMVMQHGLDDWQRRWNGIQGPIYTVGPFGSPAPGYPLGIPNPPYIAPATLPTQDEADSLSRLIRAAKAFDDASGQPDCEMDSKKKLLTDLAEKLGVKIEIPE